MVVVVMMEASQQILVKCYNNNNSNNIIIITNHPTPVSQALARRQLWLHRRRWRPRPSINNNKPYHLSYHLKCPNSHPKVPAPGSNRRPDVAKVSSTNKWPLELAFPFALLARPKFGQFYFNINCHIMCKFVCYL
jgi:hypothetical protein